jgi:hypothetical protein
VGVVLVPVNLGSWASLAAIALRSVYLWRL